MEIIEEPWEKLGELVRQGNTAEISDYLDQLSWEETFRTLTRMDKESKQELMSLLSPRDAAEMVEGLPDPQIAQIMETLQADQAAAIISEMESDDRVDIIGELEEEDAALILSEMEPEDATHVRKLIRYDPDTAGGMMLTEYLAFDEDRTVGEVSDNLKANAEEYERYHVQYIYVTRGEQFSGVLRIRDLLLSKPGKKLSELVIRDPLSVDVNTPLDELIGFFDTYDFYGVPVLDEQHHLVGIVLRKHVLERETERASSELLATQGIVGGEEIRTMPVLTRSRRRLSWLSVNILLNILAASVIAFYQDTLSSVIALAVFLPIISDMSGCSGNQAVAVSLRELSLGLVKPYEMLRVWWQEVSVGLINGTVLGILIGLAAYLWKGNPYLGLVIGGALCINTLVAVSIGGTIPLLLKRFQVDPALASGPILTTITDMFGFFLALMFATAMLGYIT